jgi:NADPH:quinone reductase-like Zn-dependent oxidoreductase
VIDVHAAGLNFRDLMWAMGLLPEEALTDGFAGPTFGLECAGIISAVGAGVADLAVGDRVAGFAPAALSTQVTTAAHAVTRIPLETSFAAAATIPVVFVTAVYALGTLAKLMPGELVLIHAAAGGVGTFAVQLAVARGARVIGTASGENKERLRSLGAIPVTYGAGLADRVRAIAADGVDAVLDASGRGEIPLSIELAGGPERVLTLWAFDAADTGIRIHVDGPGATLVPALNAILGLIEDGRLQVPIQRTYPLTEAAMALDASQSGHVSGKLVLVP